MMKTVKNVNKQYFELKKLPFGEDIVYQSQAMKNILQLSYKVARVDCTVLISGESGVGKEVIAAFIQRHSLRKDKPFIKINCGALPESLLESELFGYVKGAFTGASKHGKPGLFELADQGTLFLDEIGEMPLSLQVKLLRVIQERELRRIGGTETIRLNVRLIAATNLDLQEEVKRGRFREDLYYRLNVIPIHILPLRERKEDILPLIEYFADYFNRKHMKSKRFAHSALELLQAYEWPGNVRELQNVIERLIIVTDGPVIDRSDLPEMRAPNRSEQENVIVKEIMPLKLCVHLAEIQLLKLARKKYGSTTKMAQALGVDQSTISRKLKKMNL